MQNKKRERVNPKELKGKERTQRVMNLMEKIDPNVDNQMKTSDIELIKKGPDDKVYGIVRENKKYYVKRTDFDTTDEEGRPIIGENDLKYIGGIKNKTKYGFPSYSKALKQMNQMFTNIFESKGERNNIVDPSVSDNVLIKENDSYLNKEDEEEVEDEGGTNTILYDDKDELEEKAEEIDRILRGESPEPEPKTESKKPKKFSLKENLIKENEKIQDDDGEDENNPWAICRAQQNKHGWSDEKTERCIKDVKEKEGYNESVERGKKKLGEDEEDSELEDKRYVLRNPENEKEGGGDTDFSDIEGDEDPLAGLDDEGLDDGGSEEEGGSKPFEDEPFDPGVEADEEEEPRKFIQQLTGKLSQSMRNYAKEEDVDTDLEQYVVNMLLDAVHFEEMSEEEKKEMINTIEREGDPDQEEKEGGEGEDELSGEEELDGEENMGDEETGDEEEDEDEESIEDELGDDLDLKNK